MSQSLPIPEELDSQSLIRLQEGIQFATDLVKSANQYAEALKRNLKFSIILSINSTYLSPRSRFMEREDITSCVAIRVLFLERGSDAIWTVDTLQEKLSVMADLCIDRFKEEIGTWSDPFSDLENHFLIGVSNAYLQCLFYSIPYQYSAPILSPRGREMGKINFTLQRLSSLPPGFDSVEGSAVPCSVDSQDMFSSIGVQEILPGSTIYLRIHIKEACNLPPNIPFVFCQYRMWGFKKAVTVRTSHDFVDQSIPDGFFSFNHIKILEIEVTDGFVDYCKEGVLSIEVLGNRMASVTNDRDLTPSIAVENSQNPETKWIRIRNYVSMTMNILELNEEGDYSPVELKEAKNTSIGGTYQLNQGQTRKIQVSVQKVRASGNIELGSIHNVEIGSMYARSIQDDQLDSFQEIDFNTMKDKWEHKLLQRRDYLDGEMQELMDKKDKNSEDLIKESKLNDEWLVLQQERNILVHSEFHEIIGTSINWKFPVGYEPRAPILFINTDDKQMLHQSGYLLGEDDKYIILKFKHGTLSKLDAIATWGLNDHEDRHLQSITSQKERVYIILRVTVALKHPPSLKIILRKRLMLRIIKKETVFFNPFPFSSEKIRKSGVVYEIFCGLPHMEGLPIHIDLHPSILEPNEGESLVDTFQREMKEISDQLQLDQWKQELSLTEQLSKAGIIQLGYPSSDSLGPHSEFIAMPRLFQIS